MTMRTKCIDMLDIHGEALEMHSETHSRTPPPPPPLLSAAAKLRLPPKLIKSSPLCMCWRMCAIESACCGERLQGAR